MIDAEADAILADARQHLRELRVARTLLLPDAHLPDIRLELLAIESEIASAQRELGTTTVGTIDRS